MIASLALQASPSLGSAVWQPVGRTLAKGGWLSVICVAAGPVRTGQDVLDAFVAALRPVQLRARWSPARA